MPKTSRPAMRFRTVPEQEARRILLVEAAILRAQEMRYDLREYTRKHHVKEWTREQREAIDACGKALAAAVRELRRHADGQWWGVGKGRAARKLMSELPPLAVEGDVMALRIENMRLRTELTALHHLLSAKQRLGFSPRPGR